MQASNLTCSVPLLQQHHGEAEQYRGELEQLKEKLKTKSLQLQSSIQTGRALANTNQTLNDEKAHLTRQLEVSMVSVCKE